MTRFNHQQIKRICQAAGIKDTLKFNDFKISGELALAVLLVHHSFPRRLYDMVDIFGIYETNLSRVCNGISHLLFHKFRRGIEFDERHFSKENLSRFSEALVKKGAILDCVVGFIDGTMQQTCRPGDAEIQNVVYNRLKHIHCLKLQAISTPDGITSSLCGPYHGSHNDQRMFNTTEMIT
ncbi:hypothetical protein RMATCC62417_15400 [Rhizopus microsporus]|nr:hypothetical protein RMATCC62417_15400 [Rhizopus microsporus]